MRWIGTFMLACLAGGAMAQAPFTIVRPVDGAKVREKVKILIPKDSVPVGGYVGLFLNGKFVEAMVPSVVDKYYQYILDTKGRGLADGKAKIEMDLFVDYNDTPKIVDRSSVNVTIANKANIPIPRNGIKLRYKYRSGTESFYKVDQRILTTPITASQAHMQNDDSELPTAGQQFQMIYSVDNSYGNGDGLLRLHAAPPSGKNSVFLQIQGDPAGRVVRSDDFGQVYMRLSNTGNEVFGALPVFFPDEGIAAPPARSPYFTIFPLPSLPPQAVRPGDFWQTRFQMLAIDQSKKGTLTSVVKPIPMRGEFVGLEWEMGHPCAKIHQSIAAGTKLPAGIAATRFEIDETFWFALDKGEIIKIVRRQIQDRKIQTAPVGTGAGGGQAVARGGSPYGVPGAPGITGPPGSIGRGPGGRGGSGMSIGLDISPTVPVILRQNGLGGANLKQRLRGRGPAAQGAPGAQTRTGPAAAASEYMRTISEEVLTLEG